LATHVANGQQVYFVGKSQAFTQSDSSGAVADPTASFQFSATGVNRATLILPLGSTMPLAYLASDQEYAIHQGFTTKAALDTAFPLGTYQMTGTGIPTLSFNLTTDNYPVGTPQVTSGTWNPAGMLVVNPTQATTINLNTFTGYSTSGLAGHMQTNIESTMGDNVRLQNQIATVAIFGMMASPTPLTSLTIPAGTLTNGRLYQASVSWDTITTLDTTTVAGSGAVAVFTKQLTFYIAAQTPGTSTPPPVITNQPTNQTGVLGGRATFTVGVTVGGSTNFSNVLVTWMRNGQDLGNLNASGGKYTNSNQGWGLTINNLTAADAGNYSVKFGNAGGFVTSATATLTVASATPPTINRQPVSQAITQGSTVVFAVDASGVPAATYQWRLNGFNVPAATSGATGPVLVVQNAGPAQTGAYTVVVANSVGTVTSAAATLTLGTAVNDPGRLINLSILTPLAAGEPMTMGTVLGGGGTSGPKPLLARAAGPTLGAAPPAGFGLPNVLPDPTMTLVNTSNSPNFTVASNNDWGGGAALSNAFAQVGAFAYAAPNSKDAALFQSGAAALSPGNYTVQVSDAGTGSGTVIAELYDATPAGTFSASTPRLINVSVLKQIETGAMLTVGFYVGGSTAKTVLIRAVGPSLGQPPFNISSAMADPQLTLFNSSQVAIAGNDNWGGNNALATTGGRVGAFALFSPTSRDAVLLMTLAPGSYTVQVSPVSGTAGGTAIVEVYEVP
jgi:hypothetical protein